MLTVLQYIGALGDGGAETLVKDYALLLNKDKFRVMLLTIFPPDGSSANSIILKENNVPVISLYKGNTFLIKILRRVTGKTLDAWMLKRIIKRFKPSVIHVHQANLYALKPIAQELGGIRLLYTCHSLPENFIGSKQPKEHEAAKYLIENNKLQMIALHEEMKREIDKMFDIHNTIVVNNGIDFEKYKPLSDAQEKILRDETGLSKEDFVIGHVGRFSKVKNHKFIISVFTEVLKRKQNAKLLLIGAGPLESEIRALISTYKIENNVVILSHRSDVNCLLRLMNVFLFPSLYEGLGIVLIEAQVSDLKCIM